VGDGLVLGLDAAGKRGWVGIALRGGRFESAHVFANLETAVAHAEFACIGVDIPILRGDAFPRPADRAARKFVGPKLAGSVFSAPPVKVFRASDYEHARRLARASLGQGVSSQTFALRKSVLDAQSVLHDARVHEAHPEVTFSAMAGTPLHARKKTWEGHQLRRRLLAAADIVLPDDLGEANVVSGDDILDAAAVAWTADRIARGCAGRLPEDEPDSADSIWY
jgi:predicted RNase H-like nuclease